MSTKYFLFLLAFLSIGFSANTLANDDDEFDVDQADSLDFESFHKPKEGAIKIYDTETGEFLSRHRKPTKKTYPNNALSQPKKPISTKATTKAVVTNKTKNKRFDIRQRFTTGLSDDTTANALAATNTLYSKMAKYCPTGWIKKKEWAVQVKPTKSDYYLHYEFECL